MKAARYFLIVIGLLAVAGVVSAQTPQPPTDDEVNRVAKQMYCPVCENVPLDVCPTTACADWRADIRDKLAQGWTEQEIKDYFAAQYGDRVLAAPPVNTLSPINITVYVVPPLALLVGGFMLYRFLRQRRAPVAVAAETPAPAEADDYQKRLEQELRERL